MAPDNQPLVEFFFDYGSPFSYLANTQLTGIAARTGALIVYRPMLLGAVLKAVERGVFGAPAFFVGDELFWGNDRLDFVEHALRV